MTAAIQTIWANLIATTLADAGVEVCVISPGSRSTPLVAALASSRLELVTLIDERAAAFYALGAARATGRAIALVCTSGTAAAHYLPAIVEASMAHVPLLAITANRPPELHDCGASQTIDQRALYGGFVRGAFDLGAPIASELGLRAVRRKVTQAITLAHGPDPGPVHLDVPLRKPLEPAAPSTDEERALAASSSATRTGASPRPGPGFVHASVDRGLRDGSGFLDAPVDRGLRDGSRVDASHDGADVIVRDRRARAQRGRAPIAPPRLIADRRAIIALARVIASEPRGVIVAGAMPVAFGAARDAVFELAAHAGYPVIAEAGSQLRFGPRPPGVVLVEHFDLIPDDHRPAPAVVVQLGCEPVAACWPGFVAASSASRWVLAGPSWRDPDSSADGVILGDVELAIAALADELAEVEEPQAAWVGWSEDRTASSGDRTLFAQQPRPSIAPAAASARRNVERSAASLVWRTDWRDTDDRAAAAVDSALAAHPRSEAAVIRAAVEAMPVGTLLQIGNSLPIRVVDHVCSSRERHGVITQRGAAGIDGLIAGAAGATRAGKPVLLVLGDVSFTHDLGGLLAARAAAAPLAILVIDNRGGQIFAGLPIARAELGAAFEQCWLTAPDLDPAAVASALGIAAITVASHGAAAAAIRSALAHPGATVIHAPVAASGAYDVRRTALQLYGEPPAPALAKLGGDPS